MTKAPSVEAPNPTARNSGIQCRQARSSPAITTPATAFSMKAGPMTSMSRYPSNHNHRWTAAETSTPTAASIRIPMTISLSPDGTPASRGLSS